MNLISDLRELAEDLYSAGGHNRYATALSKAADELESLQRYRTAYNEWVDKTEWVQADTSLPVKYLGMHRADVLKDMISELEERCAKWGAVFGHLGDTPDECGNAIIAARDELEERCAALTDALRSTAQTLAWMQHGKCRGFSDDLLTTNEALEKARAALEKLK